MTALPYPIPIGVIEPGDGDPATRVMGRITAGTQYARSMGLQDVTVCLNRADFGLYRRATSDLPSTGQSEASICDGAQIVRQDDAGVGCFKARNDKRETVTFPLMTDIQYLASLSLKPGMFVVREGDLEPRELLKDPLTTGVLRVGKHRYDSKGHPLKRNVPAILYAWDEEAMEGKAERGELTDMEKAFFATIIQHQRQSAWLESLTAVRQ